MYTYDIRIRIRDAKDGNNKGKNKTGLILKEYYIKDFCFPNPVHIGDEVRFCSKRFSRDRVMPVIRVLHLTDKNISEILVETLEFKDDLLFIAKLMDDYFAISVRH